MTRTSIASVNTLLRIVRDPLQLKNAPTPAAIQVCRLEALLEAERLQSRLAAHRLQQQLAEEQLRGERLRALHEDALSQRCPQKPHHQHLHHNACAHT